MLKALEVVATLKETAAEVLEQARWAVGRCWEVGNPGSATVLERFSRILGELSMRNSMDFNDLELPKMGETVADGQNHRFQQ